MSVAERGKTRKRKSANKTEWAGVARLADETTVIAFRNRHRSLVETRERIEHEQRRALKPLLDKAATIIGIYEKWGIRVKQFEDLQKELKAWTKGR